MLAVDRWPEDQCFTLELFPDGDRIADGDGVSDEENPGLAGLFRRVLEGILEVVEQVCLDWLIGIGGHRKQRGSGETCGMTGTVVHFHG